MQEMNITPPIIPQMQYGICGGGAKLIVGRNRKDPNFIFAVMGRIFQIRSEEWKSNHIVSWISSSRFQKISLLFGRVEKVFSRFLVLEFPWLVAVSLNVVINLIKTSAVQ